jgi:hypothetical protein
MQRQNNQVVLNLVPPPIQFLTMRGNTFGRQSSRKKAFGSQAVEFVDSGYLLWTCYALLRSVENAAIGLSETPSGFKTFTAQKRCSRSYSLGLLLPTFNPQGECH